ncbi:MAG: hypothetical protein U0T83_04185 [Bacteriovoracaceae bacterium]
MTSNKYTGAEFADWKIIKDNFNNLYIPSKEGRLNFFRDFYHLGSSKKIIDYLLLSPNSPLIAHNKLTKPVYEDRFKLIFDVRNKSFLDISSLSNS